MKLLLCFICKNWSLCNRVVGAARGGGGVDAEYVLELLQAGMRASKRVRHYVDCDVRSKVGQRPARPVTPAASMYTIVVSNPGSANLVLVILELFSIFKETSTHILLIILLYINFVFWDTILLTALFCYIYKHCWGRVTKKPRHQPNTSVVIYFWVAVLLWAIRDAVSILGYILNLGTGWRRVVSFTHRPI
jgi:hypothetical protein